MKRNTFAEWIALVLIMIVIGAIAIGLYLGGVYAITLLTNVVLAHFGLKLLTFKVVLALITVIYFIWHLFK